MKGLLFVAGACLFWAVDALIRYPLLGQGVSAEQIVISEHMILTVIFLPILFKARQKFWQAQVSHVFYFFVIGGLGSAIGTLAFTQAFTIINPSLVILLQKLQPVVAIVLARIVLRESVQSKFLAWASLCLVGGALLSYKDISAGFAALEFNASFFSEQKLWGYMLALIAMGSWGSATVFGKKLSKAGYQTKEIMAGRFTMGLICLLPLFVAEVKFESLMPETWGKIALMVLISGLLAMYLYYRGLKLLPAKLCALAEMLFPLCAVGVNWVVLGAALDPVQLVGGGLLLFGSTVIQVKHY